MPAKQLAPEHSYSAIKSDAGLLDFYYSSMLINPMLVIEDKKAFRPHKEVSVGYFPYGRLAFEYSYIFREANTSHCDFLTIMILFLERVILLHS
jgi:hypothetical protein